MQFLLGYQFISDDQSRMNMKPPVTSAPMHCRSYYFIDSLEDERFSDPSNWQTLTLGLEPCTYFEPSNLNALDADCGYHWIDQILYKRWVCLYFFVICQFPIDKRCSSLIDWWFRSAFMFFVLLFYHYATTSNWLLRLHLLIILLKICFPYQTNTLDL